MKKETITFSGKEVEGFEVEEDSLGSGIVPDGLYKMVFVRIDGKDADAVSMGRRGGLVGGKARAAALSPERRSEIAKKAAAARWAKK